MGLVPKKREVGDVIVILHSAGTPHVLCGPVSLYCKDCEVDVECWRLIGEAYVHGLMYYIEHDCKCELTTLNPLHRVLLPRHNTALNKTKVTPKYTTKPAQPLPTNPNNLPTQTHLHTTLFYVASFAT
jgi:hypothetical protein